MKKILTILIFAGLYSVTGFSQEVNTKKLDSLFDALENNNKIMGSFAVEKDGKIIYSRAIGYSTIEGNKKVKATPKTLYRIGSITKMFTATMIFQLIDEGKLSLSTSLDQYFPQIPGAKKITIEVLLKHRSGLYDFVNDQPDTAWLTKPQTTENIIAAIANGTPKFSPDKQISYSNSGFYLLARIIEKITGETYNENLQKRICRKLQLTNTYSPTGNDLKDNEASTFKFANGDWEKKIDFYFPNTVGIGDMLSTTADLITFDDALLDGKLTSQQSLKLMKKMNGNSGYGMGFMNIPFYNKTGLGHGGATYGTYTIVARFSEDSLTIASFVNGQLFRYNDVSIALLSICFDKPYEIPTFTAK